MAIKNLRDVHLTAGLQDKDGQLGTSGQILSSTGSQVDWIDQGNIVAGETDKAKSVTIRVKNSTATAMSKGQVICEAVSASPPGGNLIEVALADNNGTNTMPALGVLNEDLDAAGGANDEGDAIMFGKVSGIDTSAFSVGDEVFVDDTPGGLTTTKPTGAKYIQKVGVVIRDDASNGTIEVFGAGRVNDVPTPLYVDHANQRLGIGATAPQKTLDVDGEVLLRDHLFIGGYGENDSTNSIEIGRNRSGNGICFFDMTTDNTTYTDYGFRLIRYSGVNANTELIHRGTGDFRIKGQDASTMTFYTGNSARMRVASNGNVGIGTTSPNHRLHVVGANNDPAIRVVRGNNTSQYLDIRGYQILSQGNNMLLTAEDGMEVRIGHQSSTQRMTINSSGNVGIGTTSPGSPLEVNGVSTGAATGEGIRITRQGVSGQYISIDEADGSRHRIRAIGDKPFDIFSSASSYGINLHTNSSQRMTITNTGNVGIGTTGPSDKLEVAAANQQLRLTDTDDSKYAQFSYSGGKLIVRNNSTTTSANQITLQENGNVGIGTTSPSYPLQVTSNASGQALSLTNNSSNVSKIRFGMNSSPATAYTQIHGNGTSTGYLQFSTNDTTRLHINSSGNVGIGTTSPDTKLRVNGIVKANSVRVGSSNNMEFFDYSNSLHIYSASGSEINLGGGIGGRQNDVRIGNGDLTVSGSVKMGDDTDAASASKVGTLRYRTSGNNSYVDMCMQTGSSSYAWVNIVQNNW